MGKRLSIYLSDAALAALGSPETVSGRISAVLMRYAEITREACPALTVAQWCAVCDVANGVADVAEVHADADPARWLWAEMADAPEMGEKWGVDHAALVQRLRDLPFAGRVAVLDVAMRFWRSPRLNSASTEELLREAGAAIV